MKVTIQNLTKCFGATTAVNDFSAVIESGELIALLGPSGCGKSTMLNMISGILSVTNGKIFFDDEDVTELSPEKRGVGLVFQNYALYPHMTVLENICFPLEIKKVKKEERVARAKEMAKLVHVETLLDRKPSQLSGGQQQRVAIARALVKHPRILLLDEPLSNLDARLRIEMREEIRRIQQETGITTIFVTHDQEEAMSISDHIILMKDGFLQQIARPQELYDEPANCFVADFLGTPPINKTYGVVKNGQIVLEGDCVVALEAAKKLDEGRQIILSMRAEAIVVNGSDRLTEGIIDEVYVMGKEVLAYVQLGSRRVRAYVEADKEYNKGEKVNIGLKKRGVFVFDKETGERLV
ncbi:ABC transporter ATP-binding protein [Traorella massiliensis]|uniref:ABC transporter ATP-binding protein n=1 Tax=Traorella massiliensis TaxID=1903263 RepID=UPI0008F80BCA|nr:ABC transporter ATP-binding protein [Traorella massiliensis]